MTFLPWEKYQSSAAIFPSILVHQLSYTLSISSINLNEKSASPNFASKFPTSLSLIELFGKALPLGVVNRSEVPVVIADLEEAPNEATQRV